MIYPLGPCAGHESDRRRCTPEAVRIGGRFDFTTEFVAAFARSPAVVSFYDSFCWMFLGDCEGIQFLTGLYWFASLE